MTTTAPTSIQDRIARARARLDAAQAQITPDMRDEIDARAEETKIEDQIREANREVRHLAIAQAIEMARQRFPGEHFDSIDLEDASPGAGAYVLKAPPHNKVQNWQARMADANTSAKDRDAVTRDLAMSSIVAWVMPSPNDDGTVGVRVRMNLDDEKKAVPAELFQMWTARAPGAPTSIVNVATDLAGFVAAKRKS